METLFKDYEIGLYDIAEPPQQEDCDAINLKGDGDLVVITFHKEGQIVSQLRLGRKFAETLRRGLEMGLRIPTEERAIANGVTYKKVAKEAV